MLGLALQASDKWEKVKNFFKDAWPAILHLDDHAEDGQDLINAMANAKEYYEQKITIDRLQNEINAASESLKLGAEAQGNKAEKDAHNKDPLDGGPWAGPDKKDVENGPQIA